MLQPIAASERVELLEVDPDLGRYLDPSQVAIASERLPITVETLRRGPWTLPPMSVAGETAPFGLLVLDGLLVRETTVGDHPSAELLGAGDVVRLAGQPESEALLPRLVEWSVLSPSRVAWLTTDLIAAAAPWPDVLACVIDRTGRRADRLNVMQAITHLTRVDDRLLALLWYLAERWGRVGPEGVTLTLRLPHRTLAGMVGARRPSVTTALGQLIARGAIERRTDGAWILRGTPAERGSLELADSPADEPLPAVG